MIIIIGQREGVVRAVVDEAIQLVVRLRVQRTSCAALRFEAVVLLAWIQDVSRERLQSVFFPYRTLLGNNFVKPLETLLLIYSICLLYTSPSPRD